MNTVKTRFAPSPTGHLHVGSARTALFSYLLARKFGGTFLLRIEDTDRSRHVAGVVEHITEDLRWLGIQPDEGVGVGGDNGPYIQSERLDIYNQYIRQLLLCGKVYPAFETNDELFSMRQDAQSEKRSFRYPRPNPLPTVTDFDRATDEGRPLVLRFKCPGKDVTIVDEVYGSVTVSADQQDDFVIRKADAWPTYHFAHVVDDYLMGVNVILRGQEFLGQTWRHKLLREAFGWTEPRYIHLPLIMDMKGKKLSKRDGDVDVFSFRKTGYLPEVMVNFIALLGWSPGTDREKFTLDELVKVFSIDRISKTNAKFDRNKLLSFNTVAGAKADNDRLLAGLIDFLSINDTPIPIEKPVLQHLLTVNRGFRTFADIVVKSGILFAPNEAVEYDLKAVEKVLTKNRGAMLVEILPLLAECEWTAQTIKNLVIDFCKSKDIGMGQVAQLIRVAVTGCAISPMIGDTLVLLGKEKTLARIRRFIKEYINVKEDNI